MNDPSNKTMHLPPLSCPPSTSSSGAFIVEGPDDPYREVAADPSAQEVILLLEEDCYEDLPLEKRMQMLSLNLCLALETHTLRTYVDEMCELNAKCGTQKREAFQVCLRCAPAALCFSLCVSLRHSLCGARAPLSPAMM